MCTLCYVIVGLRGPRSRVGRAKGRVEEEGWVRHTAPSRPHSALKRASPPSGCPPWTLRTGGQCPCTSPAWSQWCPGTRSTAHRCPAPDQIKIRSISDQDQIKAWSTAGAGWAVGCGAWQERVSSMYDIGMGWPWKHLFLVEGEKCSNTMQLRRAVVTEPGNEI